MIFPVMCGWIAQKYSMVPAAANVWVKLSSVSSAFERNVPFFFETTCGMSSALTQVTVVPAFTVSELTAAFKIGFIIYLAFVIVDLVVANVLVALGMMMFSPTVVSIPLKLLLFVLLDGWSKLIHGLILTYR